MSKLNFKYQLGVHAECRITGLSGTLTSAIERINGCIQYGMQPKKSADSNFIPDCWMIDEDNLSLSIGTPNEPWSHEFAFQTGDKLKNRINGFEGIVITRKVDLNKCEHYNVEAKLDKDYKEVTHWGFKQEYEKIGDGLNAKTEKPVKRERTGCDPVREERF